MKSLKLALAAAALASASMGTFAANLVTNGGFEADSIGGNAWSTLSSVTGWTSTGLFEIQKGSDTGGLSVFNQTYEGIQYLELNSTNLTTISQTLNTSAGVSYDLSFAYSGRSDTPSALPSQMQVFWNGTEVGSVKAKPHSGWIELSFDGLVATGAQTVLSFKSIGPVAAPSYGSYLDGVSVSPVPEPSTYGMMAAGLGVLAFVSRRSKKKSV